ncbi:MAG TPA: ribonuclease Y [Candidatus Aminicenantes bacterium]|nr:ribonuclease Y [Candidatus Aminicenantes bacterium]
MNIGILYIGLAVLIILAAGILFIQVKRTSGAKKLFRAGEEAAGLVGQAKSEAQRLVSQAQNQARQKLASADAEFERMTQDKRRRLNEVERRLVHKEENLDRKIQGLDRRDRDIATKERSLLQKEQEIENEAKRISSVIQDQLVELERISGMTQEEAKAQIVRKVEDEARLEAMQTLKRLDEETRAKSRQLAAEVISGAIQRSAAEHVVESTVSVVDLPSEDMKGRIIGREGRNIRALEVATGVDIIVDDTPEAVILSSFDPVRREAARLAIQRLVLDGRIHPARIEEVVENVKAELEDKIRQDGEAAAMELRIQNLHPELIKLMGKLKFRTSYGQNVLQHSKEVAFLSAAMAQELGLNTQTALRAGFLHDVGKAIDREVEGTHTELSVELCRKYGENEAVVAAIASHHRDVDFPSIEAVLVQAADTLSAARPGARRELLENYIKRLEKLETLAKGFEGVSKAFALQAGREIRIMVDAGKVADERAGLIAKDIAAKIKNELDYPGQIKVTVIREMRAVEYAR